MRRRIVAVLGLVLLAVLLDPAGGGAHAEEPEPLSVVRPDADAREAGAWVAQRWPALVAGVARQLGLVLRLEGSEVLVVHGVERMQAAARVAVPPWAGGVTVGASRIVVRVDGPEGERLRLASTLRHEAVHLLWARAGGPGGRRLPRWFEEGIAEEVGGEPSVLAGGARLEAAAARGTLLDFATLTETWPQEGDAADLAYKQARSWVGVLVARAGWDGVRRVLARVLAERAPRPAEDVLDGALRAETGRALAEWHAEWRAHLEEERSSWWLWLFSDVGGALIGVAALVCAVAYLFLRRRRRRAIEALPDEPWTVDGSGTPGT